MQIVENINDLLQFLVVGDGGDGGTKEYYSSLVLLLPEYLSRSRLDCNFTED